MSAPRWDIDPAILAASPRLQRALTRVAERTGRRRDDVAADARRCLGELRSGGSDRVLRWIIRAGRALCGAGYERIDYDPGEVERIRALFDRYPTVVLSSHRSYLDGGALNVGFHDHGLPPLTVFAGINMAFWPVGAIWRRARTVFIRRQGTDEVYKAALRECVATLVEQRRPLQWFIEGTRSRTGRMGEPRIGLLAYVVDALREGRVEDVMLVPVSVAYERLREVSDYAAEARGAAKRREGLGWLLGFVRSQRGRFGAIYVRFGEPVSVRAAIDAGGDGPDLLPSLAREVTRRIEAATVISGTAAVAAAMQAVAGSALASEEIRQRALRIVDLGRARGLPVASSSALADASIFASVLSGLAEQGLLVADGVGEPGRWRVADGAEMALAYYANTIAHVAADAGPAPAPRADLSATG